MSRTELLAKLTDLILDVPTGSCIVELGTYHGNSTMFYYGIVGDRIDIFTIDDFDINRKNWMGGFLESDDEAIFYKNITEANVKIKACRLSIEDAVERWIRAIGFISWDIGEVDRFRDDLKSWSKFIIPHGIVVVKDTPKDSFHTHEVIEELLGSGEYERICCIDSVTFLRKLK